MKSYLKRALALLAALAFALTGGVAAFAQTPAEAHGAVLAYLAANVPNPIVNSVGGEWTILALARGNASVANGYYGGYISRVKQTLRDNGGVLPGSSSKKTEYSRVVIALSALGEDVTNFDGYNLLLPLANFNDVKAQGINGVTYALIAFDTLGWDIPAIAEAGAQTTRRRLIDEIIRRELAGGGFAQDSVNLAPDTTAMALQALAPYQSDAAVAAATGRALAVLSDIQAANGGFVYGAEGETAESAAQVVTALAALGIDPATGADFAKAGGNPLTALLKFQRPNGSFYHVTAGTGNTQMATEQAAYALVAYDRLLNREAALYDMRSTAEKAEVAAARTAKRAALNAVTRGLSQADYTSESWTALQTAIAQAIAAANIAMTLAEINAVAVPTTGSLVKKAADGLAAGKAAKIAAINAVTNGLNEADYTPESWAALQSAITQAIAAVNAAATVAEVNAVSVPSKDSLVLKADELATSKATKIAAINAVGSGLNATDYTPESWAALQSAITQAIAAVNAAAATVQVNAVAVPTTDALVTKLSVTKAAKIAAINAVGSGLNATGYTPESWTALQGAKLQAIADVNAAATAEAVNAVALPSADGLILKSTQTPKWWESPPLPGWLHWILRYLLFGWIWMG